LTVAFFVGVLLRFFVVVVERFRVGVSDLVGFRVVATARFTGAFTTTFAGGESGSGGRPRTSRIALLC